MLICTVIQRQCSVVLWFTIHLLSGLKTAHPSHYKSPHPDKQTYGKPRWRIFSENYTTAKVHTHNEVLPWLSWNTDPHIYILHLFFTWNTPKTWPNISYLWHFLECGLLNWQVTFAVVGCLNKATSCPSAPSFECQTPCCVNNKNSPYLYCKFKFADNMLFSKKNTLGG